MIQRMTSVGECLDFMGTFYEDPQFSDPMLSDKEQFQRNFARAMEKPETHCTWGIFRDGKMIGLFTFLVLPEEKYLEMLVGLCRDRDGYREIFEYLEGHYSGYDADFVFNPGNYLMKSALQKRGAAFEPEQQKMVLENPIPAEDTSGVEAYTPQYAQQYFAIHNQDMYWTGEKVAAAPERFRTYLALHKGKVVGYLDVTCCFAENEIYDLLVLPEYRRMGYGGKLLAKAENGQKGMMLLVDADNEPAIRLYQRAGFVKKPYANSLTAHWKVQSII